MKTFYDVHIHSCLSPCADDDMTPNNIINMAILKELDIIAVTDHNSMKNLDTVIKIAKDKDILVVPGMELQTKEEVHMVCLFKELKKALEFEKIIDKRRLNIKNKKEKFGNQLVMNETDEVVDNFEKLLLTSIDITIEELLLLMRKFNGVTFPAHIDRDYASIVSTLGFIPEEYNFRYVEVSQNETSIKILGDKDYKKKYYILRNSDAHNLWSINEPIYSVDLEKKTIDCFINKLKRGIYMKELSLHILDIARNSITADSDNLRIAIIEDIENNLLTIKIKDDGKGMNEETLKSVVDPFYTTRTTRNVGLGIPMFKANAENCNGKFNIESQVGVGTEIIAEFQYDHIDRVPIGNMSDTIVTIINGNEDLDLLYTHCVNDDKFTLNTKEIRKRLGEVSISNIDVLSWLKSYIKEGLEEIRDEI